MNNNVPYHIPALLTETVAGLDIKADGVYVDVTFGGGGHSNAILQHLGPKGRLLVFDQDIDAFRNQQGIAGSIVDDPRVTTIHANFCYLSRFLRYYHIDGIDGLLADLGVSFHHFDDGNRGFSFRFDEELDMRMNRSRDITAKHIVNTYDEEQLSDMFFLYGELRQARQIARSIIRARAVAPVCTTMQLAGAVQQHLKNDKEKKDLARLFQALRIEVNQEMTTLKSMIEQAIKALKPQGRLAVLTYHSLEDRIIKNYIKTGNPEGRVQKDFYGNIIAPLKPLTNKAITASDDEISANPRSRSAKLRIGIKL